jgi:hypothetical protein
MKVNMTGLHFVHDVTILRRPRIINDLCSLSFKDTFGSALTINFML